GRDRNRSPKAFDSRNNAYMACNNGNGSTLVAPCSLLRQMGNRRLVTPEFIRGSSNVEDSNLPLCNDDSLSNHNGHGQRHRIVLAKQKSRKSPSMEHSSGVYVSSLGELFAGAFMEDETFLIKKREEEDSLVPFTAKLSLVSSIKVGPDCKGKGSTRPNPPQPRTGLD
ncbi:hypothetical protein Ancab_014705, partial [Ancistrocladus abbreviatus]